MKNKRILFIAPSFFDYELEIKKELENLGAIVDFYDDRPSNLSLYKILLRLEPLLVSKNIHNYFNEIIDKNKNTKYDYIFFIKCEGALEKDLIELKQAFHGAKFILYLYDSINNIKHFDKKRKYFDIIYSFDLGDVEKNNDMEFLPLFFLDCYKKNDKNDFDCKYDLSFIGTAHSDRPKIINELRNQLKKNGKSYFLQLYVPSRMVLFIKKILFKDFRALYKHGHITLKKIPAESVSRIIEKSNVILDINHSKQSGLTMRTIELIGMNKKIATTNENIKEYDFFNDQNVTVINREKPYISEEFLINKYKKISANIYESYSIHSWIECIFNEEKEDRYE